MTETIEACNGSRRAGEPYPSAGCEIQLVAPPPGGGGRLPRVEGESGPGGSGSNAGAALGSETPGGSNPKS